MPDLVSSLRRRGAASLALAALVVACSPPPPPPPPTIVELTLAAAANANPTTGGSGAPTIVRVYQLTSTAGFEKAEFFRLFNGDTALLGQDLVKKDEYLLAPGTEKKETLKPEARVTAIGVMAAYREFGSKTWRVVVPVPANKTTPVTITVGAAGLVAK